MVEMGTGLHGTKLNGLKMRVTTRVRGKREGRLEADSCVLARTTVIMLFSECSILGKNEFSRENLANALNFRLLKSESPGRYPHRKLK